MVGDAFAPGTADTAAARVPPADRWGAARCLNRSGVLALAVPAESRPTAAEAATARNVRIDRLTMTFPLHCAATSHTDGACASGNRRHADAELPRQPGFKRTSQQKYTFTQQNYRR